MPPERVEKAKKAEGESSQPAHPEGEWERPVKSWIDSYPERPLEEARKGVGGKASAEMPSFDPGLEEHVEARLGAHDATDYVEETPPPGYRAPRY